MKTPLLQVLLSVTLLSFATISPLSARSTTVPLDKAVQEANALVRNFPNWQVMLAGGSSMKPHYSDGDVLLVDKAPLSQIRTGMMVVYLDREGDLVGHTVIDSKDGAFVVRGINNRRDDQEHVTAENYRGVIVGVLHTNGRGATGDLPTVLGKRQ